MMAINEKMTQAERSELFGCLIDTVEDWLEEKGFAPKDFPNADRKGNEDEAIIFGEDYDHLADRFAEIIGVKRYCDESNTKPSLEIWAEREVELACRRENPDKKPGEFDYGCSCYASALKAFKSLLEDEHSGYSIGVTKNILNRLIEVKVLTPIEDVEDIWNECNTNEKGVTTYQCSRMSSLFKDVYPDGTVKYTDVDRVLKVEKREDKETFWHSGLTDRVINELYPIKMPYFPAGKPYKVYCEDFLTDEANGDYDTVGILYAIKPDGSRLELNRYFGEIDNEFKEISAEEYEKRKKMKIR